MQRLRIIFVLLLGLAFLSACNSSQSIELPTLIASMEPEIQVTATTELTTEVEPILSTPTERATLPPTWTASPTEFVPPTAIPTMTPFTSKILSPACDTFAPDRENSDIEFVIGVSPRVSWTPVEGAVRYYVELSDINGVILTEDIYINETSYVFVDTLFKLGQFYGWTVYPIDANGDQMCYQRGLELIPVR